MSELPETVAEMIRKAHENDDRIAVMDGRKRVAWIVGEYDIGTLKYVERRENAIDQKAAREARIEGGGSIPWEQVKRDLGLD
jgi:hypothetical protein